MLLLDDIPLLLRTLLGIGLVLVFLRWYEPRMVFYPHVPSRQWECIPSDAGLDYEDVTLVTSDGVQLSGWWLPGAALAVPRGLTLLFLHGNAGNISHRLEKARTLLELGLDVFLLDYRGYGQSEGQPGEAGLYQDATSAYKYLIQVRGIEPRQIVIYGESHGTGVAVDLAARVVVGGVILEAAFTSVADVAQRIFWFLPVHPLVRNRFDSIHKIARISAPLLLLHSVDDRVFRLGHARRLLDAARSSKQLVELRGTHDQALYDSLETCRTAIASFLPRLPAPDPTQDSPSHGE